jgi:RNA polymerase sigma factor (sigma-70 family)
LSMKESRRELDSDRWIAVERTFKAARGRLIAALVRRFGTDCVELVEDAVQEAGARALERWEGDPSSKQLEGWLLRVAYNVMIDALRREKRVEPLADRDVEVEQPTIEIDDELRLIFLCCHPALPRAAQLAVTLRVAFGFSTAQIARAFLTDERTVAQRIVRAKRTLREEGIELELPDHSEVVSRIRPILDVLYQIFTEGYSTTASQDGIDGTLCNESLRLARLLTDDERWTSPGAEALRALFCFQAGRIPARRADDGSLLLLQEQDRSRWDEALIAEGFVFLERSARGEELSRFHVEAGIAACHAKATGCATTEWTEIVTLYDTLREISPSPVVDVNRAFAIAMCEGAHAGLDELDVIPERELLAHYAYALATYAELHASLGHIEEARLFLDRALEQRLSPAERRLLIRKRDALGPSVEGSP